MDKILYDNICCALTHDPGICDSCKKCLICDSINVRHNIIKQVEEADIPAELKRDICKAISKKITKSTKDIYNRILLIKLLSHNTGYELPFSEEEKK